MISSSFIQNKSPFSQRDEKSPRVWTDESRSRIERDEIVLAALFYAEQRTFIETSCFQHVRTKSNGGFTLGNTLMIRYVFATIKNLVLIYSRLLFSTVSRICIFQIKSSVSLVYMMWHISNFVRLKYDKKKNKYAHPVCIIVKTTFLN